MITSALFGPEVALFEAQLSSRVTYAQGSPVPGARGIPRWPVAPLPPGCLSPPWASGPPPGMLSPRKLWPAPSPPLGLGSSVTVSGRVSLATLGRSHPCALHYLSLFSSVPRLTTRHTVCFTPYTRPSPPSELTTCCRAVHFAHRHVPGGHSCAWSTVGAQINTNQVRSWMGPGSPSAHGRHASLLSRGPDPGPLPLPCPFKPLCVPDASASEPEHRLWGDSSVGFCQRSESPPSARDRGGMSPQPETSGPSSPSHPFMTQRFVFQTS